MLFLLGLIVGATLGFLVAALLRANDDDCARGHPL